MRFSAIGLLLVALLVSGCGFQLRGAVTLPEGVDSLYVGGQDSNGDLAQKLRALLRGNNIEVVTSPGKASYSVILLESGSMRRTLALDSQARAAEYLLTETARFEVRDSSGALALAAQDLQEQRVMAYDPDNVTGKAEEESLLRQNMRDGLAAQIARRLRKLPAPAATL